LYSTATIQTKKEKMTALDNWLLIYDW